MQQGVQRLNLWIGEIVEKSKLSWKGKGNNCGSSVRTLSVAGRPAAVIFLTGEASYSL